MIFFERKYSLKNGNKVNKNNWHKVFAADSRPNTNILGVPAIDKARKNGGKYYNKYKLVYEDPEPSDPNSRFGYIFREVNAGTGINGHHGTYRKAIFSALESGNISVFLED